jgi:predicted nucleic acid-binding protein
MRFVTDTSVWVDYLRGLESRQTQILDAALDEKRVILPDLVLLEVLRGVSSPKAPAWVESVMDDLEIVCVGGRKMAIEAAQNYRILRSRGLTIRGSIDLLIGTWCIENNVPLLHNDRDFGIMEQHLGLEPVVADDLQ